jgi:surface antigen
MAYVPRLNSDGMSANPKWYSQNPFWQSSVGLPNCTCYCWGRFWEISDPQNLGINRPVLSLGNAKEWYQYNINISQYPYGDIPKLGAILCFAPPAGSSRYGHVGTVEQIFSDHIVTSNSDYGGQYFYLETLYPDGNGKYHHDVYTSQGFIYNPWAEQEPEPTEEKKKKSEFPWPVAWYHWNNFKK